MKAYLVRSSQKHFQQGVISEDLEGNGSDYNLRLK